MQQTYLLSQQTDQQQENSLGEEHQVNRNLKNYQDSCTGALLAANEAILDALKEVAGHKQQLNQTASLTARLIIVTSLPAQYNLDYCNLKHRQLLQTACTYNYCTIHYLDKLGASQFPYAPRQYKEKQYNCLNYYYKEHLFNKHQKK